MAVAGERTRPWGRWFGSALAGIFVLAVAVRLTGVLRAAGLYGLGNYDDGVHFAAALGLVNGLVPYRDFLLLQPPGVVLALAPFAALSWLIGEPDAMAVARVSWMLLGGVNAVLCGLVLKPVSRVAGLVAALFYALSIGAVYVEHTTLLEAPATTVLLLALVITRLLGSGYGVPTQPLRAGRVAARSVAGAEDLGRRRRARGGGRGPGPSGSAARADLPGRSGHLLHGRVPAVLPGGTPADVADGGGRPGGPTSGARGGDRHASTTSSGSGSGLGTPFSGHPG